MLAHPHGLPQAFLTQSGHDIKVPSLEACIGTILWLSNTPAFSFYKVWDTKPEDSDGAVCFPAEAPRMWLGSKRAPTNFLFLDQCVLLSSFSHKRSSACLLLALSHVINAAAVGVTRQPSYLLNRLLAHPRCLVSFFIVQSAPFTSSACRSTTVQGLQFHSTHAPTSRFTSQGPQLQWQPTFRCTATSARGSQTSAMCLTYSPTLPARATFPTTTRSRFVRVAKNHLAAWLNPTIGGTPNGTLKSSCQSG